MTSATAGHDSVVANPEISVIPVIALPARSPYREPKAANSASYSPSAIPTPITAQDKRNIGNEVEMAIRNNPIATPSPLLARMGRPPYRAISRLVNGASIAETRMLRDSAPYTHWLAQPVSFMIGSAMTAIRKNEPPQTRTCSIPKIKMPNTPGSRVCWFKTVSSVVSKAELVSSCATTDNWAICMGTGHS
ncbi:hypothetical protein D9M71_40410 [compost metagenome]